MKCHGAGILVIIVLGMVTFTLLAAVGLLISLMLQRRFGMGALTALSVASKRLSLTVSGKSAKLNGAETSDVKLTVHGAEASDGVEFQEHDEASSAPSGKERNEEEVVDEEKARRPTAADLGVATRPGTRKSPREALLSHYVVGLTIANLLVSFAGPLLCLWLLFDKLSHGPFAWDSLPVLGPVLTTPWVASVLTGGTLPIGMPEAYDTAMFVLLEPEQLVVLRRVFPFLGSHPRWRRGIVRHLCLGTQLAVFTLPAALLLAKYGLGGEMGTWTHIWFLLAEIFLLTVFITPLAALGFMIQPNYERVRERMSDDPNPVRRILSRAWRTFSC